eukprot:Gb_28652 [translate_table: standard]
METILRLIVVLSVAVVAVGDPETKLLNTGCSLFKVTNTTLFNENLDAVLESLRANIASTGFATRQQVEGSDPVYGLAQCRKDKSPSDCLKCFSVAEKQVRNCSNVTGGRVIYDGCFLRYESNNFFTQDTGLGNTQICSGVKVTKEANEFVVMSQNLLDDLCAATPRIDGFFAAQMRQLPSNATKVYALVQCLRSVSESGCQQCLQIANSNIKTCFPVTDGRAVDVGCYLRYSTSSFFPSNATTDLTPFLSSGSKSKTKVWIIVAVVGGAIVVSLMILLFIFRHSLLPERFMPPLQKQADASGATELRGPVNFNYKILRNATNNFDASNKLGEGGFGQVYKGTIKNGKTVAVKKLSLGQSPRVIAEFESEVKLISNVHHRNLVRLLGCCNKGPERLLVYEYMPNGSLDRNANCIGLQTGENGKCLSWEQRLEIIVGTARGVAYLHEDFHVRIIHRDIKCSNILLDENFYPKIADFGLARLLPGDQSHLSTRFAGTLGYTAPEYAIHGQLTEKADTYSYGVVVLEILSGRKSIDMRQPPDMQYLLEWVWKLKEMDRLMEVVDEGMNEIGYPREEALRVIQLALLCTQASVASRPAMSEVVAMLVSRVDVNPQTTIQPAFIDVAYRLRGESSTSGTSSSQSNATVSVSLAAR